MAEDELVMVYELRLCSNGTYYLYYDNELLTDEKGNYITFSKFEKESADYILGLLNMYYSIANNKNKSSSQDNLDDIIDDIIDPKKWNKKMDEWKIRL